VLLAAVLYLVMGGTAFADLGPARQAGLTTRAEVRDFQRSHGLVPDGVVGPDTRAALQALPHGRGHMRMAQAAAAPAAERAAAPRATASRARHGGIAYLAMFAAGWAILLALAVLKLRKPVTYRMRILRDSLMRPSGRPAPGVRWLPSGHMFAEGRAARAGIGRFSGSVSAITELRGERCFLVRDRRMPRGVWVFESEVRDLARADDETASADRLP
jgi:Putative peptidoglycan binding domain